MSAATFDKRYRLDRSRRNRIARVVLDGPYDTPTWGRLRDVLMCADDIIEAQQFWDIADAERGAS